MWLLIKNQDGIIVNFLACGLALAVKYFIVSPMGGQVWEIIVGS